MTVLKQVEMVSYLIYCPSLCSCSPSKSLTCDYGYKLFFNDSLKWYASNRRVEICSYMCCHELLFIFVVEHALRQKELIFLFYF